MRLFEMREVDKAVEFAAQGGQALHLHTIIVDRKKAPKCFRDAVDSGKPIAHLFDRDFDRLIRTARKLGVRVIAVERAGGKGQHIDLCGKPLDRAIELCEAHSCKDQMTLF